MVELSADILRTARVRAGLTQQQLGDRAGVAQSVVSAYEAGRREPSLATLRRLVDASGMRLDISVVPGTTGGPISLRVAERRGQLRSALRKLGARNPRLFGSVARGEERTGSDVDILVDLPSDVGLFALARMRGEAERILGTSVDIVPESGLKADVAASVLREAVPL